MNAIDQMMQTMDAKPTQSIASFFEAASSPEKSSTEFAKQFATALSGAEDTPTLAQAIENGLVDVYAITSAQTAAPTSAVMQQALVISSGDPDAVAATQDISSQIAAHGLQLVKVTPENFETLYGNLQSPNTNGPTQAPVGVNVTAATGFTIAPNFLSEIPNGVHILPMAELEALITMPETMTASAAMGTSTNSAQIGTPSTAAPAAASPSQATIAGSTPEAAQIAQAITPETASVKLDGQEPQGTVKGQETVVQNEAAKTLAERAGEMNAAKLAKEQPVAADAKGQKTAEAEAHGVQTQQAANAAKKPSPTGNTSTTPQSQAGSASATTNTQGSSNNQSGGEQPGEQKQQNTDTPKAAPALAKNTAAPNAPQLPPVQHAPVTWTPERLSGFGDGFTADTFAGGLSGLRGESSFLSSMGILGGKASPHMGGQIAKQLNLQVTNAVRNGANEFTMRLDPAELGRVQVKMQFGADGRVAAQIMVERPETLELLQREARGLERAIESGGHKAENGGISFSLDTSDGESAGKAFAEAMHQDRLKEQLEKDGGGDGATGDAALASTEETDSAILEEILSRVTPETGLDVRV